MTFWQWIMDPLPSIHKAHHAIKETEKKSKLQMQHRASNLDTAHAI